MQSLSHEFLVLSRQLGQAQQRCSARLVAQAAHIESLQAEIVRLRAAVMVRDTRLAMAHEALESQLIDADWVICQTGCLSHDAYWRVEDHCRRTGKTCVLVDQALVSMPPRDVETIAVAPLPAAAVPAATVAGVLMRQTDPDGPENE
ncbi:MAG: DUF2325 domain-containing protein [Acidovorax sp.]|jgi:hypothetical protein|nr:DUF2325 domain-containing protein [Acidovorax sp.]